MSNKKKETFRKTLTDDFLNAIKNEELVSGAQKVINSAVNVLEEEIAAGILAAKKIEKKILDVDDIRNDPDDLMNRIRRDTHEAVDLFLDAITALSKQVSALTATADKENKAKNQPVSKTKTEGTVTLLKTESPLKPGQSEVFKFVLFENSEQITKIKFQKSHLLGPNNQIINSRALKISPETINLKPNEEVEISIQLKLPKNALPGHYNAFIHDEDNSIVNILLKVEII
ncbi:hypothetical protein [Psychroserpens luteus]|uniref:Uncharacterized protein n=1 Tax=Psychroserpens luteus TaxID=1434066 RepID=A0ABW5ZR19_9FLAO|nr:hypothetical protein [Psychroserpens luteus]